MKLDIESLAHLVLQLNAKLIIKGFKLLILYINKKILIRKRKKQNNNIVF